jgi:asparagine synthase (glutamine-hydrolysing)
MPGIVGLITRMPLNRVETQLSRMIETLRHESFYVTGTFADESLGVHMGWVELKQSSSDEMPLSNEELNISLVFSGEEYPDPGTARHLKELGHSLNTEGRSYLVHLYEDDQTFPSGLNGVFHGLLVDQARGTVMLFNDRYGMHRIYYHQAKDAFYFAAEAKAILAVRPELRTADPRSLGELAACGCVMENRTVFQGIHVLPPASAWVFRNGLLEQRGTYFETSEWEDQEPLDAEAYYRELRDVFSRNLPRYFNGRQKIGMSLTGGLDTRMIMAWQKSAANSLPCYTFGGTYRECQDVRTARKVATSCEQSHQVIPVGDEFLSRFSSYASRTVHLTEGNADVYRSPDLYVSEKARQIAPVKIVGTYGSEIIRQAIMFKPMEPKADIFRPEFLHYLHRAKDTYGEIANEHPVTFAAFRQSPWYHFGILALEQDQLTVRSPFLDNDFVRTVFRAPKSATTNDIRIQLVRDGNPTLAKISTDRGVGGDRGPIAAAVAHGLLEFTFKAEYAYDYGMPQWLARIDHLLSRFRPERIFLGRHKPFHFRVWYRDALSNYVRETLLDPRALSRPYIEPRGLEAVVNGHLSGKGNYTTEIHKLLTLELLHRIFFDAND